MGRHGARIDGEHVAPGGEHVACGPGSVLPRGRARRTCRRACRAAPAVPSRGTGIEPGLEIGGKCWRYVSLQRGQQRDTPAGLRNASEHVESVPDLEILDVAEIGVEPRESVVFRHVRARAAFLQQAKRVRAIENVAAQQRGPPVVETVGAGVFVDQPLQFERGTVRSGGFQRWCQVSDGDRRPTGASPPPLRRGC